MTATTARPVWRHLMLLGQVRHDLVEPLVRVHPARPAPHRYVGYRLIQEPGDELAVHARGRGDLVDGKQPAVPQAPSGTPVLLIAGIALAVLAAGGFATVAALLIVVYAVVQPSGSKVVILAFNDAECTTVCPLTTAALVNAKEMLGAAGSQVQLLGINANPKAIAVEDLLSYSKLHGMLYQWRYLTGSLAQLESVWKAYSVGVTISQNQTDHEPAIFVIDTHGWLAKLYLTQQAYSAAAVLPGRDRRQRAGGGRLPGAGTYKLTLLVSPPVSARYLEYQGVWLKPHKVTFTFTGTRRRDRWRPPSALSPSPPMAPSP